MFPSSPVRMSYCFFYPPGRMNGWMDGWPCPGVCYISFHLFFFFFFHFFLFSTRVLVR
ncbi:hypothetical protein BO70DRAFT_26933 [Aspergillus heteromorphus CBS 117.55]|uniref:Uncharacterized protein n=1 Tax=Aspergillus heteromorphus CBS 117.55 TaxID=1448321 RepID=A0A317WAC5_9EURO|nr:uncharacterized protein BO70DRAFT_26933 [Aspergillus heteromorphus CBS 117.55]PWY83484.1 hypothetical protein BO70DRAFT_26933 [Aspergillus heteromorphus CBS 117.55]